MRCGLEEFVAEYGLGAITELQISKYYSKVFPWVLNFTCCGPAYPDIVIDRLAVDGDDLFGVVLGFQCTKCFNTHVLNAQAPTAQAPNWQVLNVLAPNVQVPNAPRVKCPMVGCPSTTSNSRFTCGKDWRS